MARGNGEGSVYQEGKRSGREDGRWVAQVVVDGKLRRRFASTEAAAKKQLRTLQAKVRVRRSTRRWQPDRRAVARQVAHHRPPRPRSVPPHDLGVRVVLRRSR